MQNRDKLGKVNFIFLHDVKKFNFIILYFDYLYQISLSLPLNFENYFLIEDLKKFDYSYPFTAWNINVKQQT